MPVRVRFAPSPTGYLHIGGARTALYNFLFARRQGGAFVLRVEDTDRQRSTEDSVRTILEGLAWLGLAHDEGPHFQSQRLDRYVAAGDKLERAGRAYWKEDEGKGKALYFRLDRGARVEWDDLILGPISVDPAADAAYQRDLVALKADGFPTYNFACVIDDADLGISHVIRGQEHVANTPKQLQLYRALGLECPAFAHIPLIQDPAGAKISKRKKYDFPVTIEEVRELGYLPAPFVNFLALLGWSPGGDLELMSLDDMIRLFSLERVNRAPARFLREKLDHMNGLEIRKLPLDRFERECLPFLRKAFDLGRTPPDTIREAVRQQQERVKRLCDIVPATAFVFAPEVAFDAGAVEKILRKNDADSILEDVRAAFFSESRLDADRIEPLLRQVAERRSVAFKLVAQPLRVALTGGTSSPPIHETVAVLGRDRALERIDRALGACRSRGPS